jgi:hypothetical protein
MKYIIVADSGFEKAILFDELLSHKMVAGLTPVVSAGFCSIDVDNFMDREPSSMLIVLIVRVWGESVTLNLQSRKTDAALILEAVNSSL